ncbi:iron-molybdenum cofactor biosynthesis protein [bacterium]|nr:iron-molybdenum cofactor biosynthesis protein [bacterium]MBU1651473.1 iron-molybdenum cofactor biosynthesis protein [bacterium]
MRIAIPSDDGIHLAAHTGRTSGFKIYDIEDQKAVVVEYRTNQFTGHAQGKCDGTQEQGNHHHHSHDSLLGALDDCNVMIARGMGPRLVTDLASRNIQVMFCDLDQVDEIAELLAQGKLQSTGKSMCDHGHH